MTKNEAFEILKKIHDQCEESSECTDCAFYLANSDFPIAEDYVCPFQICPCKMKFPDKLSKNT